MKFEQSDRQIPLPLSKAADKIAATVSAIVSTYADDRPIEDLAPDVFGPLNRKLSKPGDLRFGTNGSKSVDPEEQVWYDHEAKTGGGYVKLLEMAGGSPKKNGRSSEFRAPTGMVRELGKPVAWWDYHDADGATVARVVRFEPPGCDKTFRQCRPDGDRWKWRTKDIQIPLYRLPDLLRAPHGSTVFITEGEKHTDLLRTWGLVATTNAGGAKAFRDYHATMLADRGFRCLVLPDNDNAGQEHEQVVLKELHSAGCKDVRVIRLPNLPPKGDIINWAAAGGTREELERLVDASSDGAAMDEASDPQPELPPKPEPANDDTPAFFDPWSDPPPPQFPSGILPPAMEAAVFAAANRDGVCSGALAMAYLAAVSGAANKASRFSPYPNTSWSVPPVVWVMPIAESGQRKTAIQELAFEGVRKANREIWNAHHADLRRWKKLSKTQQKETPKPDEPAHLIVEDVTPEKLQAILADSGRGVLLLKDEMAGMLEFGRYTKGSGSAERGFYLQAYEGGDYTVSRLSRDSVFMEVNAVTLYGAIQPDRLADFPDLAKDGLIQRINMIRCTTASAGRDDVQVNGLDAIDAAIEGLTKIKRCHYRTTPEGSALIRETERIGNQLATVPDFGPGFQGTCSKLHGTHARYAMLLHLLEAPQDQTIATDAVERAGRLVHEFLLPQARDFFSGLTGSPTRRMTDIAGWILTKEPKRFLASDLTTGIRSCRGLGLKELTAELDSLVTGGWLDPESPFPSNRAWKVQPNIKASFLARAESERLRRQQAREFVRQIGCGNPDKSDGNGGYIGKEEREEEGIKEVYSCAYQECQEIVAEPPMQDEVPLNTGDLR
jgi:hypothetical protein